ncbi:MAG TPA: amidohydrolase family protein [Thermoanaerobaculia bacterium]|nr:amidohydrolase family protein [Thermoanaerobaculia bacterium]
MHFLAALLLQATAFVGVNVLPMDGGPALAGQTVVVRDARVERVGPIAEVEIPADARVVYGRGRWLVPGLVDMHVHIREVDLPAYISSGVTTVRDLAGLDSVLATMRRVERGEVLGPRILASSKLLTGPNPGNPFFSRPVTSVADAARAVDEQLARGATSIKVYEGLSLAVYDAIVNAAHARGVQVSGHVSQNVGVAHAMVMQDCIEHLSAYPLPSSQALLNATRDSGVWNCPTQVVFRDHVTIGMPPDQRDQYLAARRALVGALDDAGARILAGTDAGYLVPAGTSLHEELAELSAAGLTNEEVLASATRNAGEYLGDPTLGVIHTGARADLLLVNENPLENLATLRHPAGVMVNGRWISYDRRRAARKP